MLIASSKPTAAGNDSLAASTDWGSLLWRRKLSVILVLALAVGLGLIYYQRAEPVYQSSCQLLLIKNEANLPITGAIGQVNYEDTISTHMILVRSPLIVSKALDKMLQDGSGKRVSSLVSLRDEADPLGTIIYGLEAVRGGTRDAPDPNVIELNYRGVSSEDCVHILDAVIASYQDFLGETYQDYSKKTVDLITEAKDVLSRQLQEKETAYREFRESSPQLITGASGDKSNIPELRMAEIEKARSQQLLENTELRAQIDSITNALHKGGSLEALALLASSAENSHANQGPRTMLEQKLFDSMLEEQLLLQSYGSDHPDIIATRRKVKMLQEHLGKFSPENQAQPSDFVNVYVDSLKQELEAGVEELDSLNELFSEQEERARSLTRFQLRNETFRNDIERTQLVFENVINRLNEISLVDNDPSGVKAKVISPPGIGEQVEPNLPVILALALGLGMVIGIATAYGVEMADQRFRSPEDLRAQLELPIVGHIPLIRPRKSREPRSSPEWALDKRLCTVHQPESRASEAYRAIRTALYFGTRAGTGNRIVQITSPTPSDGKTTLSANLAVTAANSGKRVLLLEADFRRPRLGPMFAVDTTAGVSTVIAGDAELNDALHETPIEGLYVMPCGPRPHNPSELLTTSEFQDMLQTLRGQFDLIVVDTPPLLAVTDPAVVAPRVDAVLLVVSLGKNVRHVATRATDLLRNLDANVLGVVVNRFDKNGAYLAGGYRYGYGYEYHYRYGHNYKAAKRNATNGDKVAANSDSSPSGSGLS